MTQTYVAADPPIFSAGILGSVRTRTPEGERRDTRLGEVGGAALIAPARARVGGSRCAYCGHWCHGYTCRWHSDLTRLETLTIGRVW